LALGTFKGVNALAQACTAQLKSSEGPNYNYISLRAVSLSFYDRQILELLER